MKRALLFALLALCVANIGCAHQAYAVHPGAGGFVAGATPTAAQTFDSQEYDVIATANTVNQGVQADYLAGKFPTSAMPAIRAAENASVAAYNVAQSQWTAFDASLKAGGTPSQAALTSAVAALQAAIAQLTAAKGGTK